MWKNYFKIAWRNQIKNKSQFFINIGGMAVGMAVAILAVFISCLGLFGLISFVAEQRTKEIGIRKVQNLVMLLIKDIVMLVIISILIASPIAWYFMSGWLKDYAYRIDINWWIFAGAGLLALFIALVTVSGQAIKAAVANPVKNLRTE